VLLPAGPIAAADRGLVERVLAQSGVARTPVPPQSSYLSALAQALGRYLAELIRRGSEILLLGPETQAWMAATLVVLAAAALAWGLLAVLRRRHQSGAVHAAGAAVSGPAPAADLAWDAEAWRAELERCLCEEGAGERTGAALRAAWWWLARSIAGVEAEADWTSRDLAARVRHRELRDVLRRLDVLTFGADRPGLADLRRLAERIGEALRGVLV
jgi:hypothetical protein